MHHNTTTTTITTTLIRTISNTTRTLGRVFITRPHGLLTFHLPKPLKITFQRLNILLESQRRHRPKQIIAVDRLPLLTLTLIGGFAGDEADEL
ncbi:hypothetical protein MtrunA17_Chr3g0102361 [Medicago truncatula]|uniref:Uncharacterized protein n=1 Tax=Medicago truncatula TaxID=3880 RepID=A0A396IP94_MEDTR|nr:hypothetical protein MtrunA17_Chr3g0102361 [Medicago truncatula]